MREHDRRFEAIEKNYFFFFATFFFAAGFLAFVVFFAAVLFDFVAFLTILSPLSGYRHGPTVSGMVPMLNQRW
jgi:hypothetical protein